MHQIHSPVDIDVDQPSLTGSSKVPPHNTISMGDIGSAVKTTQELQLLEFFRDLVTLPKTLSARRQADNNLQPQQHKYRYDDSASNSLLYSLFWTLACGQPKYMRLLFPDNKFPVQHKRTSLSDAQGAEEGAEYTEAARGKACGHIFKAGEATYRCKTCSADDTCVLCSKCYASSDHTDHTIMISISPGNSGCCDCGDPEAWKIPVNCTIHTEDNDPSRIAEKEVQQALPAELESSIRMTISHALDYINDVLSCSPEHLRLAKTIESVTKDEQASRLNKDKYGEEHIQEPMEYAVLLWNDEKHTVAEVRDQVARACKMRKADALEKAYDTDAIGRSIVKYGDNLEELLGVAAVIEQIKVAVSVRSASDIFREQMCGTIIEWLSDIAGCSVENNHDILRRTICEEMLKPWERGSEATNAEIGKNGLFDEERTDREHDPDFMFVRHQRIRMQQAAEARARIAAREAERRIDAGGEDPDDEDEDEDDEELGLVEALQDIVNVIIVNRPDGALAEGETGLIAEGAFETDAEDANMDLDGGGEADPQEAEEATIAGYPRPPPPPLLPAAPGPRNQDQIEPSDSDMALDPPSQTLAANMDIPKTPGKRAKRDQQFERGAPYYWLEVPKGYNSDEPVPLEENMFERVRLDWMVLFDLRMWKKIRIDLRDLYISTVVAIPAFKRILGLRFGGLYTLLAQLYLIADREPDNSIVNLSVQMLTTPSITAEAVERGNFFTNLLSVLFTFLTTRQVGPPHGINRNATLKFDSGGYTTNRRMYHFFIDLKYLFASPHMQDRLRMEERYLMQFLDLVKLHQGIVPNNRITGDHIEYENDTWISASLITRELNKLCRQCHDAFMHNPGEDPAPFIRAIRFAAKTTIINSLGLERKRFEGSEIKEEVKFRKIGDFEFDNSSSDHKVVKFDVLSSSMSFYHALHHTLSWLVEGGKGLTPKQLSEAMRFTTDELLAKPRMMGRRMKLMQQLDSEDLLMAMFDYPIRMCAWLAQMNAGLWVRNGMSLKHQANQYRSVSQRDVTYNRDILLIQTAMVVCSPERVLATMVERFGLTHWMKGIYEQTAASHDNQQQLDIAQEMIHLLIIMLTERLSLLTTEDEPHQHTAAMKRDIIHALVFKPLTFTEICSKLPDKFSEEDECSDLLEEMTDFRPPIGMNDSGTFTLKDEYLSEVDPYVAYFNKGQREEAEAKYIKWLSVKTGTPEADIVFETKLQPITTGVFANLSAFTKSGMFAQIIYYSLLYTHKATQFTPTVPKAKVESFLQMVLHLILLAVAVDDTPDEDPETASSTSFIFRALTQKARSNFIAEAPTANTIVALLELLAVKSGPGFNLVYEASLPNIKLILKRMRQKKKRTFDVAFARLGADIDRISTPTVPTSNPDEERERRRKAALARQAKIKAEYQERQKNFATANAIDWGVDEDEDEDMDDAAVKVKTWKFPQDQCLFCQDEHDPNKPVGTFAMISPSHILRQTDFNDADFVREAAAVPENLDASAEDIRPFGVSGENTRVVEKIDVQGKKIISEESFIGKGFPAGMTLQGALSTGCSHVMHYTCFEKYTKTLENTQRTHVSRHPACRLDLKEFSCPLCRSLGNAFLPHIWQDIVESYPGILGSEIITDEVYDTWLSKAVPNIILHLGSRPQPVEDRREFFDGYLKESFHPAIYNQLARINTPEWKEELDKALITSPPLVLNVLPGVGQAPLSADENIIVSGGPRDVTEAMNDSTLIQLTKIFYRIADTLKKNGLQDWYTDVNSDVAPGGLGVDVMANAVATSVAAAEIKQRGVDSEGGSTFISKIPEVTLTHLRVLAATAATYTAFHGVQTKGGDMFSERFWIYCKKQVHQIFGENAGALGQITTEDDFEPLLSRDIFSWLTEATSCMVAYTQMEVLHVVRLCYIAEMVKVLRAIVLHTSRDRLMAWADQSKSNGVLEDLYFVHALLFVLRCDPKYAEEGGMDQEKFDNVEAVRNLTRKYALVFLRKVALLLYVQYGVDFNSNFYDATSELDRLSIALRLPSPDKLFSIIGQGLPRDPMVIWEDMSPEMDEIENSPVQRVVERWLLKQRVWELEGQGRRPMMVSHPALFELIGLPKNYDTLVEATVRAKCRTTGKEVTDPMICLHCATIVCGQAMCCLKTEPKEGREPAKQIGGCQQHMRV